MTATPTTPITLSADEAWYLLSESGPAELRDVVREPAVHLQLAVATSAVLLAHRIWATPNLGVALLDNGDATFTAYADAPQQLVPLMARAIGLGPRPKPAGTAAIAADEFLAVLDADEDQERQTAAVALVAKFSDPDVTATVVAGRWRAWAIEAVWPEVDGSAGTALLGVLDTDAGALRVGGADDSSELTGVTSTEIWTQLIELFPLGKVGEDEGNA